MLVSDRRPLYFSFDDWNTAQTTWRWRIWRNIEAASCQTAKRRRLQSSRNSASYHDCRAHDSICQYIIGRSLIQVRISDKHASNHFLAAGLFPKLSFLPSSLHIYYRQAACFRACAYDDEHRLRHFEMALIAAAFLLLLRAS